jgi:hypothetical protein
VQNARLNFVRVDSAIEDSDMQPCVLEVRIIDAAGRLYGTPDTFNLRPGVAASRAVFPLVAAEIEGGFQFRATFKIIDPEDATQRSRCAVISTMEVFSKQTGGTLFMYSAAKSFNLPPNPGRRN